MYPPSPHHHHPANRGGGGAQFRGRGHPQGFQQSFRGNFGADQNYPPRGGGGRGHFNQARGGPGQAANSHKNKKPWITHHIRAEIKCRNNLAQMARASKSSADFEALNAQKKKVNDMIEESKLKFFAENPGAEERWLHILAQESFTSSTFCDVCEKGFKTAGELRTHESEHATCGVDGCTYTAHQDLLEKHIKHQHLSGLFQRIPQGKSKEEIDKWRAERKKNFPTKDKVAAKDAEMAEARARGEVLRLQRIVQMYSGGKVEQETEEKSEKKAVNAEPEWECNCKAKSFLKHSRRRVNVKRLKHQSHCQELVRIRERNKAKLEQKAKDRLERAAKRSQNNKTAQQLGVTEANEDKQTIEEVVRREDTLEDVEDSDSEPEGMNGTLPMFSGIGRSAFHNLRSVDNGLASLQDDEEEIQEQFHISDEDEEYFQDRTKIYVEDEEFKSKDLEDEKDEEKSANKDDHDENDDKSNMNSDADEECDDHDNSDDLIKTDQEQTLRSSHLVSQSDNQEIKEEKDVIEDSDDEAPEETTILKEDVHQPKLEDSVPPSYSHDTGAPNNAERGRRKRKQKGDAAKATDQQKEGLLGDKKRPRKDVFGQSISAPTLLERLLSDEIKHERNLILQCVRYVCNNQFLQNNS